ncbi:MAG: DUF116 domain-containing protein [Bacteroidales bacterium]|nr:DUF116 domain-containing protein [Bacteroidales bacterium]
MFLPANQSFLKAPTYNLNPTSEAKATDFYADLEITTGVISQLASKMFLEPVSEYKDYVLLKTKEKLKSNEEYFLELIMAGLFIKNHLRYSKATARWKTYLLSSLFNARRRYPKLKKNIDSFRGRYAMPLLAQKTSFSANDVNMPDFSGLLNWLYATGEYTHEVKVLRHWERYLKSIGHEKSTVLLQKCEHFSRFFESYASLMLSRYTSKVNDFIPIAQKTYRRREDYFLATKPESEYHLNMLGAAILNKALFKKFSQTGNRIFVAPACMRSFDAQNCQGISENSATRCVSCNPMCKLGNTAKKLADFNIKTYIVPHTSDLSNFLAQWAQQDNTGIIATACTLNLIGGGYEVMAHNIPSQCIFLNFCGCKNHWDSSGITTTIDMEQLLNIVSGQPSTNIKDKSGFTVKNSTPGMQIEDISAYCSTNWFAL